MEFDRGHLSRGQLFCTGEDLALPGQDFAYLFQQFISPGNSPG